MDLINIYNFKEDVLRLKFVVDICDLYQWCIHISIHHFFIKAHPPRTQLSSNLILLVTNARTKKVSEMALKQHKFAFESANVPLGIACQGLKQKCIYFYFITRYNSFWNVHSKYAEVRKQNTRKWEESIPEGRRQEMIYEMLHHKETGELELINRGTQIPIRSL